MSKEKILHRLRQQSYPLEKPHFEPKTVTPTWDFPERVQIWKQKMEATHTEIHETTLEHWLKTLKQILTEKNISRLLYSPNSSWGKQIEGEGSLNNSGKELVAYNQEVEFCKEELFTVDAGITSTRGAIAETGTLVLWPTPEEPRLMSLVPPIHIVILEASKMKNHFGELMEEEHWETKMPTNALLISGPSKTADIEFKLAYGIHGPCELVVLLLQNI